ncbi:MAG: Iron-sulfur cluster repair protein YtfE [Verrucomicrobiae bacterium]|nr:Iron-sulfur cluster repair protein YtfE [Verrucomicrobiae bacterium]
MPTAITSFTAADTVGSLVAQCPALSRVFEQAGIDYCCGGKIPLAEACRRKGFDPQQILTQLEAAGAVTSGGGVDPSQMSLTELADHIVATHHAYLKMELPRLEAMTTKVARVHGDGDVRLPQVNQVLLGLQAAMTSHMDKEEQILFPLIRELEASATAPEFHCGSLANPVRVMELEHDQAGGALVKLRELTDGFTSPDWACNTYRAMLDALAHLEHDLYDHIHKENNILFPRAIALETSKQSQTCPDHPVSL